MQKKENNEDLIILHIYLKVGGNDLTTIVQVLFKPWSKLHAVMIPYSNAFYITRSLNCYSEKLLLFN